MAPLYLEHFGLAEAPFALAPDPRYLFLGADHRDGLAHLLYGLESDSGLVVLTGDTGSGKTSLCHCLLEQLPPECDLAFIFNPQITVPELLATICEEFHIPVPESNPSIKSYIDRLAAWLRDTHQQGRRAVVLIDEAQALAPEIFEQIRLLTNLETSRCKLLHIVLVGQGSLRERLQQPEMEQFAQRVVARFHIGPLSAAETNGCVAHRLAVAGTRRELFSPAALERLYRLSGGVPRRICVLADRSLLGAYTRLLDRVEVDAVTRADQEILGKLPPRSRHSLPRAAMAGLGAVLAVLSALYFHYDGGALAQPLSLSARSAGAGAPAAGTDRGP